MSVPRPIHPAPSLPAGREPLGSDEAASAGPAPDATADRVASFAFWGRDRVGFGRAPAVSWFERLRGDPRVGAVALLAVALLAGLLWYRIGVDASDEPVAASTPRATVPVSPSGASPSGASSSGASSSGSSTPAPGDRAKADADAELVVHVAGVVVRPGVVRLRAGARVFDAIEAAGGARPEADLDQLNLAAKIADGQRIAVGLPGQAPVPGDAAAAVTASGGLGGAEAGPLNLNIATQAEMEELPGIGPVLGAAILRERDERGGFRSVDELRSVRGIGEKRFADLRDLVTV